ncbi:hypothetical protein [uncultured Ramlibacter sp.]|uniref:hypothetical protein n=1 Tax=uncultured Ramlibacter sp. TaxID=260755 RepID=UPI00261CEA5F|nr:hypothetical protein [uncultured Ramlibacter sp.]
MTRALLPWGVAAILGLAVADARSTSVDEQDIQQLLRLTAIGSALGSAAPLDQLLCMDDAQGRRPLPPAGSVGAQLSEERLRRGFELCRLQASQPSTTYITRLVGELRTEFLSRLAKLIPVHAALVKCRDVKQPPHALSECIARTLGRPPSEEEVATFSQGSP